MQDTTLEPKSKKEWWEPVDAEELEAESPYNVEDEEEVNSDNTWAQHLNGIEVDVPLAVKPEDDKVAKIKKKFKVKHISNAQQRAIGIGRG